jgi:hypothetical protein
MDTLDFRVHGSVPFKGGFTGSFIFRNTPGATQNATITVTAASITFKNGRASNTLTGPPDAGLSDDGPPDEAQAPKEITVGRCPANCSQPSTIEATAGASRSVTVPEITTATRAPGGSSAGRAAIVRAAASNSNAQHASPTSST